MSQSKYPYFNKFPDKYPKILRTLANAKTDQFTPGASEISGFSEIGVMYYAQIISYKTEIKCNHIKNEVIEDK